ncbi:RluA family pseudouridine synthase [Rhodoferax ferrireducens]|uniref:RluA family pseudouridine synthase n=1 Tax=Rhodoferax ferrireducens TaxID=192843 RepID=UPI000E0DFA5E|nr:RluA family pseudouridine synthase [Rhodoferax ferrireducens]
MSASEFSKPPARNGVGPSCIGLPAGNWSLTLDFLAERFAAIGREVWRQRMLDGDVVNEHGITLTPDCAYQAHVRVYYYRAVPDEPRIPFDEVILFQDEQLIVVDKPHFLPVMPSGGYLTETVLVRLKQKLGIDTLVPVHRIDRDTAGLVMFSVQPETRAAYHALFSQRSVKKTYEAIAPWRADLKFPLTRESRIVEAGHFMLQHEVDGPPNAVTEMDVLEVHGALARYALSPVTGKRHQLRVHMAALGLPILGDGLYPTLTPEGQIDYAQPLQLLARSIEFVDPVNGQERRFESRRVLQAMAPEGCHP